MPVTNDRDSLPYGAWTSLVFPAAAYGGPSLLLTFWPFRKKTDGTGGWPTYFPDWPAGLLSVAHSRFGIGSPAMALALFLDA